MDYNFNINEFGLGNGKQNGALENVPVGAVFVLNDKRYLKLCNDSRRNSLAITIDPLFDILTAAPGERETLYHRIFTRLRVYRNEPNVNGMWTPTEEEYADYSHLFKQHFNDEWFVNFDEDNDIQDIEGEYVYANRNGILCEDNANGRYRKDPLRVLAIRAMCLIDQKATVWFKSATDAIATTSNKVRYDLAKSYFRY